MFWKDHVERNIATSVRQQHARQIQVCLSIKSGYGWCLTVTNTVTVTEHLDKMASNYACILLVDFSSCIQCKGYKYITE